MRKKPLFLSGLGLMAIAAGVLLALSKPHDRASLSSVVEIWGDVVRDVDGVGMTVTRVSAEREMEIGRKTEHLTASRINLVSDPELIGYVRSVGSSIARYARREGIEYQFHLIDVRQANAYASPGGRIYITTGMLAFLRNEAELAAILGHEIAHVDLRHCIEKLQYELAARKVVGDLAVIASIAHGLLTPSFSEQEEREADRAGVLLAASAGYDPAGAMAIFQRMARAEIVASGGREATEPQLMLEEFGTAVWEALGEYFATHPPLGNRIRSLADFYKRNESQWKGKEYYIGETNLADKVSRARQNRVNETRSYRPIPVLINCPLRGKQPLPVPADACKSTKG